MPAALKTQNQFPDKGELIVIPSTYFLLTQQYLQYNAGFGRLLTSLVVDAHERQGLWLVGAFRGGIGPCSPIPGLLAARVPPG